MSDEQQDNPDDKPKKPMGSPIKAKAGSFDNNQRSRPKASPRRPATGGTEKRSRDHDKGNNQ